MRTRLGRYEILDVIGSGSMGAVFQARDPHLGRIVAVKTIRLAPCSEEDEQEFRTRLLREAEAAARLTHPAIVTIFDVGHDENHEPYFVMEYVEGRGLDALIKSKSLSFDAAIDIAIQLAEALDCAHRQGIVHRDVKPSNIIITPEGRAKITDFGIAKVDVSQMTLPGVMLGTPAYMAPEQLLGEPVDGRADLFSLGVVLYMMVTGQKPFQGQDPDTICRRLLNPDPVPASEVATGLPPELSRILGRALARKPADRYQTGVDMASDLRAFQQGEEPRNWNRLSVTTHGKSGGRKSGRRNMQVGLRRIRERGESILKFGDRTICRLPKPAIAVGILPVVVAAISLYKGVQHFFPPPATPTALTQTAATLPPVPPKPSVDASVLTSPSAEPSVAQAEPRQAEIKDAEPTTKPVPKPSARVAPKPAVVKTAAAKPDKSLPTIDTADTANKAKLHLEVEHSFKSGSISVSSDGQLIYVKELTPVKSKRLVVPPHSSGFDAADLRLAPGDHLISVRVRSDGFDGSTDIQGTFSTTRGSTLNVSAKRGEGVKLSLAQE